jgi:hypothetical protein
MHKPAAVHMIPAPYYTCSNQPTGYVLKMVLALHQTLDRIDGKWSYTTVSFCRYQHYELEYALTQIQQHSSHNNFLHGQARLLLHCLHLGGAGWWCWRLVRKIFNSTWATMTYLLRTCLLVADGLKGPVLNVRGCVAGVVLSDNEEKRDVLRKAIFSRQPQ